MNQEVKKTNYELKEICSQYNKVSFVEASKDERNHHTKHEMNLNMKGKLWLAEQIKKTTGNVVRNTLDVQPFPPGSETHLE